MPYSTMQCFAYDIDTGPRPTGRQEEEYPGLENASKDVEARCRLLERALNLAHDQAGASPPAADCLKVFIIPEFYCRGKQGAYDMERVQEAINRFQALVKGTRWNDWLFVFGSILGYSNPPSGQGKREVYNFSLVQRGGPEHEGHVGARVVMKELMSGIDFVEASGDADAFLLGAVDHVPSGDAGPGRERQQLSYDGGGIFELAGLTWGMEICLDHLEERLLRAPQLPGDSEVQVQLIPSAGMSIKSNRVVAMTHGYALNCDGLRPGSELKRVTARNPVTLENIPARSVDRVSDDPLSLDQSPPTTVDIDQLYSDGPGKVRTYPPVSLPDARTVQGKVRAPQWDTGRGYRFQFRLVYSESGDFQTAVCCIDSDEKDFHGLDYFLPFSLETWDRDGYKLVIRMSIVPGTGEYQGAVLGHIQTREFRFQGTLLQFHDDYSHGEPLTCW